MKWRIDRILHAPASALPLQERTWPSVLTLSRPCFTVQPAASDDDLSRTLGLAIGDSAFAVCWEAEPTWDELPPRLGKRTWWTPRWRNSSAISVMGKSR